MLTLVPYTNDNAMCSGGAVLAAPLRVRSRLAQTQASSRRWTRSICRLPAIARPVSAIARQIARAAAGIGGSLKGDAWGGPLIQWKVRLDMRAQHELGAGDPRAAIHRAMIHGAAIERTAIRQAAATRRPTALGVSM